MHSINQVVSFKSYERQSSRILSDGLLGKVATEWPYVSSLIFKLFFNFKLQAMNVAHHH